MKQPSPFFIRRELPEGDDSTEAEFTVLADEEQSGIDLWRYWWVIRKHLGFVLALPVVFLVLTALYDFMQRARYTAEATILIRTTAPRIFGQASAEAGPSALEGAPPADLFYNTEYQLLRSRSLAARVIAAERLAANKIFTGASPDAVKENGLFSEAYEAIRKWMSGPAAKARERQRENEIVSRPAGELAGIDAYLGDLRITPLEGTQLVKVAFTTADPELSARLANAHVREAIRQQVELNALASVEAEHFLEHKLAELERQLDESELALNNYRRDKDIVPGLISLNGKHDVILERLNNLSQHLQDAQLGAIELGTQVALIREGQANALPSVVESGLIQQLQGQLDSLQAQYSSMASELKPGYPPMHELQAKIERTRDLLQQAIASIAASVRARYSAALLKVKELQEKMEQQKKFVLDLNNAAVRYTVLEREATTNQQLYDAVLKRMKDVSVVAGVQVSNISIVDPAIPSLVPSSPRKMKDLSYAGVVGLTAGIALAFLLEYLDRTLKTSAEAAKYLRIPTLGVIPQSRTLAGKADRGPTLLQIGTKGLSADKELVASHGGYSFIAEAYRNLRTALLLSRAGAPPKSIVVASTFIGEGKSITAVNTTIVLAQASSRVLLIDADLRKPRCHKLLSIRNHRGLTEVLTGTCELDGLIHPTPVSGMFFLSSGKIPPNPSELLGSERMKQLLIDLEEQYDFIVIDTPPALAVSDALLVAAIADGTVLVVDSLATPKQHVKELIARLEHARVKIFGTVLNKAKVNGFGYSYYGSHYYHRYGSAEDQNAEVIDS